MNAEEILEGRGVRDMAMAPGYRAARSARFEHRAA